MRGNPVTAAGSAVTLVALAALIACASPLRGQPQSNPIAALISAYPNFIERIDAGDLVWKDGTRMRIDDGKGAKPFDDLLNQPDIKDMLAMSYIPGEKGIPPEFNYDPGRIRYAPLFTKMYGDCRAAEANARTVVWLPSQYGKSVNDAAPALQKVSE